MAVVNNVARPGFDGDTEAKFGFGRSPRKRASVRSSIFRVWSISNVFQCSKTRFKRVFGSRINTRCSTQPVALTGRSVFRDCSHEEFEPRVKGNRGIEPLLKTMNTDEECVEYHLLCFIQGASALIRFPISKSVGEADWLEPSWRMKSTQQTEWAKSDRKICPTTLAWASLRSCVLNSCLVKRWRFAPRTSKVIGTALRLIFTFLGWQRPNNSLDGGKWGTVFPVFR